jgi:carbamoyl-phosphate synthase large subunit
MKATGEVMALSPYFEGALMKAIRSLEENVDSLQLSKLATWSDAEIKKELHSTNNERI